MSDARKRGSLSAFDVMLYLDLPNWGVWGRDTDRPNGARCGRSICADYIPKGEDRWDETPTDPRPSIRYQDAEDLDGWMFVLMRRNRAQFDVLALAFYRRKAVAWEVLAEAIRHLLDLIQENRAAVNRMYELIYKRGTRVRT